MIMDKKYLVYKHTNKINNKVYIGLTSYDNPEKRWGVNGEKYKTCTYFYHAILKYGWNNFSHEVLETNLSQEEACEKEKYYINLYNSNHEEYGYNLTSGGERNKKLSSSSREKMSKAKKGLSLSEEHRKNISKAMTGCNNPNYGKKCSEGTKNKISDKNSKPIQCVETGIIYKNKTEAAIAVGLKSPRSIMSALKENWRTAGKSEDGKIRYHWVYFSEVRKQCLDLLKI